MPTNKSIKTEEEIAIIAEGGKLLGDILARTAMLVKPGVSTKELNDYADSEIRKVGATPSFIGYGPKNNPFPAALCTSINDVVVHGIPSDKDILKEGDVVGLDIGMKYKGLYTDTALTVPVGKINAGLERLLKTTQRALLAGIDTAKPGNRLGDVGASIQAEADREGFGVIRDLVGHGVGYEVHEDPMVPNYGTRGTGALLKEGMVLAIEPMFTMGGHEVYFDNDGWTIRTEDGSISAHFEHTIVVREGGAEILT
jgi:methionyl aminopeptidase